MCSCPTPSPSPNPPPSEDRRLRGRVVDLALVLEICPGRLGLLVVAVLEEAQLALGEARIRPQQRSEVLGPELEERESGGSSRWEEYRRMRRVRNALREMFLLTRLDDPAVVPFGPEGEGALVEVDEQSSRLLRVQLDAGESSELTHRTVDA